MVSPRNRLAATALDLVGLAYEAAAEGTWPHFLEAVADATGSEGTILWLHDTTDASARVQDPEASFVSNVRIAPEFLKSYVEHYTHTNVLMAKIDPVPEGAVVPSSFAINDREFHHTEYYNDWLRPQGIGYCVGSPVLKRDGLVSMFSVSRLKRRGPYRESDLELLAMVVPHLRRACLLHKRLAPVNAQRFAALATLELLATAVWLFDAQAQLILANGAGRVLNSRRDGLWLDCAGQPAAADPGEQRQLRRTVEAAIAAGKGLVDQFEGSLAIRRKSSPVPLQVAVYPLRHSALPHGAAVAMFITDPARSVLDATELPRLIYGLTKTEARLTAHLVRGESLADYCVANAVTANTARTHLKRVFEKTGTRRQAQLVSLLSQSAALRTSPDATRTTH